MHTHRVMIRDWLTQLWKLRNSRICPLCVGDLGKLRFGGGRRVVPPQYEGVKNQGSQQCKFSLSAKTQRPGGLLFKGRSWHPRSAQWICSFTASLFCLDLQGIWWYLTSLVTQSTDSNANLFWNQSHRHTQEPQFTSSLGSLYPNLVDTEN